MYHYLFTNDLRVTDLESKLQAASHYIQTDTIPSASVNKSLNNNICTLLFYFGLVKDSVNVKSCLKGYARRVVLNFIKKFQFPNPRTPDSYRDACLDGIKLAPLRLILQVLYLLRMISPGDAYISADEILNLIFYNDAAAKDETSSALSVVDQILSFRQTGEYPDSVETDPSQRDWKHESRQINEMTEILEWSGCVERLRDGSITIKHSGISDEDKALIFEIITCNDFWEGDHSQSFDLLKQSYFSYFEMDPIEITGQTNEEPRSSNILDIALKLFMQRRTREWIVQGREVNARIREYFETIDLEHMDEGKFTELFLGVKDAEGHTVLEPMWSGKVSQGWSSLQPADATDLAAKVQFLRVLKKDTSIEGLFLKPGFVHPSGFGPSVSSELLMKFHPEHCFKNGKSTKEALSLLGLFDLPASGGKFDDAEYKLVCGAAASILAKMSVMDIPRAIAADGSGDGKPADYLTVNEFLWFVKDQFKEIQNEVMNMSLETPTDETRPGDKNWTDVLSDNPDDMMNRLVAALLTKPFAILAGASGTGKSRMVRKLAYMTCLNKQLQPDAATKKPIENFRMVQVKPNWHDSSDLLGYRSSVSKTHEYVSTDFVRFILKAHAFPNTPFFVCLDEMNLAPVEHYFAEFLSASESARVEDGEFMTDPIIDPGEFDHDIVKLDPQGYSIPAARKELIEKRGLYIPKNLFVVGTVNMDDTTGGFSRKVLDRAMTLEMDDVNFADLQTPSELVLFDRKDAAGNVTQKGLLLEDDLIKSFIERIEFSHKNLDDAFRDQMDDLRQKLFQTPLAIAFRFARECVQYREALRLLYPDTNPPSRDYAGYTLDHMSLMKILPRLVGNKEERLDLLNKLKSFFATLTGHELSSSALKRMEIAADLNGGFLSFYP